MKCQILISDLEENKEEKKERMKEERGSNFKWYCYGSHH